MSRGSEVTGLSEVEDHLAKGLAVARHNNQRYSSMCIMIFLSTASSLFDAVVDDWKIVNAK